MVGEYCSRVVQVTGVMLVRVYPELHWIMRVVLGVRGCGPVTTPSWITGFLQSWAKIGFFTLEYIKIINPLILLYSKNQDPL